LCSSSLRLQLGLAKLPRPVGPPFDETEKPAAEKRLARLKIDAENKRVGIRNLKSAMEKLEISE
jgi:sulfur dioxygenase